ncbi:lysozyme [Streptomyces phaeofaciens]|uniref:lysozyme n=1 Tax=Streptomyces phaeofaciens TaxID=68254 RepID=UPI0036C8E2C3
MARDHSSPRRHRRTRHRRARTRPACAVALAAAGALLATLLTGPPAAAAERPMGHDVSSHQRTVDWARTKAAGARFVYVKATESTGYRNPYFAQQYDGAGGVGLLRGAYHFALPDQGPGKAQAAFFVRNGGGWSADGGTLPPALDIEYNPYDAHRRCYGLSRAAMVAWIRAFSDEVLRLTGRRPVIYTTTHWWNTCTGGSPDLAADHALWIARYSSSDTGALPAGWASWTFWQYADGGSLPGDQNLFNGSAEGLARFAKRA